MLAGLQLFGLDAGVPGSDPRAGDRLSGDVGQANQFADLLWLGAIAVVWFAATDVLPWALAAAIVIVLEFFVVTSELRETVWVYVAFALVLGSAAWLKRADDAARRRLAIGLVAIALLQVAAVSALVVTTHMLAPFQVTAAEQRIGTDGADESTSQRLWFWRSGSPLRRSILCSASASAGCPVRHASTWSLRRMFRRTAPTRMRTTSSSRSLRKWDSRRRSFCLAPSWLWAVLASATPAGQRFERRRARDGRGHADPRQPRAPVRLPVRARPVRRHRRAGGVAQRFAVACVVSVFACRRLRRASCRSC